MENVTKKLNSRSYKLLRDFSNTFNLSNVAELSKSRYRKEN